MCNRFQQRHSREEIAAIFRARPIVAPDIELPLDIFPRRAGLLVRMEGDERVLDAMRWGVPLRITGKSGKPIVKDVTNVRNLASPFWKSMLANPAYRCLVPFTRFAEPRAGKDPETGRPLNWWFSLRAGEIGALAGIWRPTEAGNAFAFLTCGYLGDPAEHVVGAVHAKAMPVVLHDEDQDRWLSASYDDVCSLAAPFPSQLLEVA